MVAAVLCGITDPAVVPRSVCAMGHKWMWNAGAGRLAAGGVPGRGRSAARRRARQTGGPLRHLRPDRRPSRAGVGRRSSACAPASPFPSAPSTRTGTPSAPACGWATWSTWWAPPPASWPSARSRTLIPGVCGVVPGSIDPRLHRHRSRPVGHRRHLRSHRAPRRHHRGRALARPGELPRRPDRPAAPHLGQRRPHRAGEPRTGRRHARLAAHPHRAGRAVRGHRRHGLPHARDSGAHGGARRADAPRHQRRRHPAEERGAQPGLRQRAGQAHPGAQGRCDQPRLGHLRVPGGRRVPEHRRGAGRAVPRLSPPSSREPAAAAIYEELYPLYRKLYFAFGERQFEPVAIGDVLPELRRIAARARGGQNAGSAAS